MATRSVVVAPGAPVLADSVLSGPGIDATTTVAGKLSELRLRGVDRFGNAAPIATADVEAVSFQVHVEVGRCSLTL